MSSLFSEQLPQLQLIFWSVYKVLVVTYAQANGMVILRVVFPGDLPLLSLLSLQVVQP